MKNKKSFFIIIILTFILTGCSFIDPEVSRVNVPTIYKPAIEGKWTVTKCIFPDELTEESFNYKDIIGTDAIFTKTGVIIGDLYSENVKYKAKKVNANEYLFKKYNTSKKKLGIESDYIYVIDIYDDDEFFYEIIKDTDETAYIFMKGFFAQITKTSDFVSEENFNKILEREKNAEQKKENVEKLNDSENGFLLGLKSLDTKSKIPKWDYKTIYIKFLNNKIENVYETSNIILPRQNEFVDVFVNRVEENGEVKDQIRMINNSNKMNIEENHSAIVDNAGLKNIYFISPEYINIETIAMNENDFDKLSLYYIDSLENSKRIELDDLIPNGKKIFKEAATNANKSNDKISYNDFNIGLIRNNGYWKLIGRYKNKEKPQSYNDFVLNVLLPKGMVKYDNLIIPFSEIKKEIPNVRDAFISPNNKFLITLENNYLRVYNIKNGRIIKKFIYEKEVNSNSTPIMAEWALGRYSELWQRKISSKNMR